VAKECKTIKQHKQITSNPFANKSENLLLIYKLMKKLINPALMKAFFESAKLFSQHSIHLRKRKYGLRNAEKSMGANGCGIKA
jgi:hypothetical protein